MHKIKVLGHRGAMKEGFYENTLSGFGAALEKADGLETDAVRSQEGEVFLVHDTDATTGTVHYELTRHLDEKSIAHIGTARADQTAADTLEKLSLKNGEPLPKLRDLLALAEKHPEAVLNIELKAHDTAEAVANLLAQSTLNPEQVFVSSFNHPELLKFRKLAPQYKIGLLLLEEAKPEALPMFPWLETQQDAYYQPFRPAYLQGALVQAIAPDYIGLNSLDLSAQTMEKIATALPHAQTYVWWYALYDSDPANIPEDTFTLLAELNKTNANIMAVITSYPMKMKALMQARGLR